MLDQFPQMPSNHSPKVYNFNFLKHFLFKFYTHASTQNLYSDSYTSDSTKKDSYTSVHLRMY